jgi:hypothetical protein
MELHIFKLGSPSIENLHMHQLINQWQKGAFDGRERNKNPAEN